MGATGLLASVRTVEEALAALAGGADILDLKEPAAGALGRLPEDTIRAILAAIGGRRPVSATIGDIPLEPAAVASAVAAMAASGVDIVKIGIFAGALSPVLASLEPATRAGRRLVAVLFGDRRPDFATLPAFAAAGFHGVMLDTAEKRAGPLTRHLPLDALGAFVARAQALGMIAGLAGSLQEADIAPLLALGADYLGFRSALATGGREGPLDPVAVQRLRRRLDGGAQPSSSRSAIAAAGAQSAARSATSGVAGTKAANGR